MQYLASGQMKTVNATIFFFLSIFKKNKGYICYEADLGNHVIRSRIYYFGSINSECEAAKLIANNQFKNKRVMWVKIISGTLEVTGNKVYAKNIY